MVGSDPGFKTAFPVSKKIPYKDTLPVRAISFAIASASTTISCRVALALLAAGGFAVFAPAIVSVVSQYGRFDAAATNGSSGCHMTLTPCLVAS